jgi:hypothetical protein
MQPSKLKTIDELTPGEEYILYEDETYVNRILKHNEEFSKNIIGKIIDYEDPNHKPRKYKYMNYLGAYHNSETRGIHFVRDKTGYNVVNINDKTPRYQSIADWEKDFRKSDQIQENLLINTLARGFSKKKLFGNDAASMHVLQFLDSGLDTKYPTDETEYVPIFKEEIENEIKNKYNRMNKTHAARVRSAWDNIENGQIRSNSLDNKIKRKPKYTRSLPNMYIDEHKEDYRENEDDAIRDDDFIPNKTHNKTQKRTSILKRLRSIFSDWNKSRSRSSRVHTEEETGGKRRTRIRTRTRKNKRKTKHQK